MKSWISSKAARFVFPTTEMFYAFPRVGPDRLLSLSFLVLITHCHFHSSFSQIIHCRSFVFIDFSVSRGTQGNSTVYIHSGAVSLVVQAVRADRQSFIFCISLIASFADFRFCNCTLRQWSIGVQISSCIALSLLHHPKIWENHLIDLIEKYLYLFLRQKWRG